MTNPVEINENLFKIDNILNALEYLHEESKTRLANILSENTIKNLVEKEVNSPTFRYKLAEYICDQYYRDICKDIAFKVMSNIDADISAFINARVDEQLKRNGINVSKNQ